MAYVKVPKTTSDHALGYQSVNALRGNFDAEYAAWVLEHGEVEPQYSGGFPIFPFAWLSIGHHNLPDVPRDVIRVTYQYIGQFISPTLTISPGYFVPSVQRISAGLYFFPVTQLVTWWGEIVPIASAAGDILYPVPRSYQSSGPGQDNGIYVSMYSLAGGVFTPTDASFTLTVYGTT